MAPHVTEVMDQAAAALNSTLRRDLKRVNELLAAAGPKLTRQARAQWEKLGFKSLEQDALQVVALESTLDCTDPNWSAKALKQVNTAALTLARCNVPPDRVIEALGALEALVTPVLQRAGPDECGRLQAARRHAQLCMILTLQGAYFNLREREVNLLLQFSSDELSLVSQEQLLPTSLESMATYSGATSACVYTVGGEREFRFAAGWGTGPIDTGLVKVSSRQLQTLRQLKRLQPGPTVFQKSWGSKDFDLWSVPMPPSGEMTGVFQFALPRTKTLLARDIGMLSELSLRTWLALKKARMAEELESSGRRLKEVARRMLEVEELERRRISKELHDDPAQALAVIRLHLEMMELDLEGNSPLREQLSEIRTITESTIIAVRRLIFDLSPSVLEQLGLAATLRQLVNRMRNESPIRVRLQIGNLAKLNQNLQITLYRITQECLNNVRRHSGARSVTVSLNTNRKSVTLLVEDDGKGFTSEEMNRDQQQIGLIGMRERVRLLGGEFVVESAERQPGKIGKTFTNTSVKIVLPLAESVFET